MPRFTKCNMEIQFVMSNVLVHLQFIPNESTYARSVYKFSKIKELPTNDEITMQFPRLIRP